MKTHQVLSVILFGQLIASFSALANVTFIVDDNDTDITASKSKNTLDDKYHEACKAKGYAVKASSCTGTTIPGLSCPNNPGYVDTCCDRRYRYVVNSACHHNATPSTDSCGGRFACICDPMIYPKGLDRELCTGKFAYDEINYCTETYVDSNGTEHETRYFKGCTCAANYARCNSSYHLHGTGDSCSYNGNIYYTSCSCDAGYNKLCSSSGAKYSKDYCLFKGKKYYRECNETESDDKTDENTMDSTDQ
ncbi:MAG: hypothetical protein IJ660_05150 [Alphaproteobacteria bacterium]|nr:hypothetical protein [Alphaproteobacteria bacterium]